MCYYKGIVTQEDLSVKPCKKYQQFKIHKRHYVKIPSKIITELNLWNLLQIDLVGTYTKSIIQQNQGNDIYIFQLRTVLLRTKALRTL